MKNSIIKLKLVSILMLTTISLCAQFPDWNTAGNNLSGGEWFGADGTSSIPLEIRHDGDEPIIFSTNGLERMRIMEYGNVGVGTAVTGYKFESRLTNANMAPPGWQRSVAIYGRNDLTGVFPHNIGIEGTSQGSNPEEGSDNIAGRFYAKNAWRNIAIDAEVGAVPIGSEMVGEHGWAMRVIARDHSLTNYGILVRASSSFSYPATEVVGISAGIDGNTGPNSWAGAFQGNVQVWGDVTANGYMLNPSDEQFKTDINSVENALGLIDQLSPKKYQFLTDEFSHLGFPEGEQYGIIA